MAIILTPETQKLIEERMKQGGFPSADEVVRAALASMDQQDLLRVVKDTELEVLYPGFREKIAQGLAEADAGKVADGEEFFAELGREDPDSHGQQPGRKTV